MNKLTVIKQDNKLVTDSREVATTIGKRHSDLLDTIGKYITHLENGNFRSDNFFIGDLYTVESNTREYPMYWLTKKGCDMVANKMTGEKGVLFTAEYVTAFEKMKEGTILYKGLSKEVQAIFVLDQKTQEIESRMDTLENDLPLFNIECKELQGLVRKVGIKTLGGYKTPAYNSNSLRGQVYSDIQQQLKREFGVTRYEAIKRSQLDLARQIVAKYKVPVFLQGEIIKFNNQIQF